MSVLACIHELDNPSDLDQTARRIFDKPYVRLSDSEAGQVWDVIDGHTMTDHLLRPAA